MVQVYAVKVPAVMPQHIYDALIEQVSDEKRQKISRFRKQADACRTLLADVLARTVVSRTHQIAKEELDFQYDAYGKPSVKGRAHIHFNASHSGDWVVLAISPAPVGIDVEKITPQHVGIAKRFFSPIEYEDFARQPVENRCAYFYDLWTLKEAYLKAVGKGLSIPLDSFAIRKQGHDHFYLSAHAESPERWYFKQYGLDPAYKLSVCAQTREFTDELYVTQPSELLT
ncbi:4'-phosphopantetheinyl transferase superfamily protein [Brevibacillus composti]|uniref:4'-phosphopantetheinyl transferase superfamily protein n=1 Tax=Brevibacillus composti TaxID=2796470 RepID=A0A7T5JMA7_9BACL|nr:4'-phosphopantetheinyl transferase superfamily protein [Brevibacillus composti]QQE72795.1 4'-phosphopantetheinyl transferase superfamily protein [Brevibacillus composti]QUO39874.1 4'-phosphopantetheinyl transferase superfamily protein [Brevibacillus composti]